MGRGRNWRVAFAENVQEMSWLSNAVRDVGGWVAGDGNTPGSGDTREYGYDRSKVAAATANILNQPAGVNVQSELVVLAVAGVGLMLLMRQK